MAKAISLQADEHLKKMCEELELSPANKEALEAHIDWLKAKGSNPRTLLKHLYSLNKFLEAVDKSADLKALTKKDMEKIVAKINTMELGIETKRDIKSITKLFYKHMLGDDVSYPMTVAWIKPGDRKASKRLPEVLSEDEVRRMIEKAKPQRDKAIIALLFDSGMRIGELLNLKIKNVDLKSEPAHVIVDGKTGMRQIPLMLSVPYVAAYLNMVKEVDINKPFLQPIGSWANIDKTINAPAVAKVLKSVAKAAGINKRIFPHLFRHSRASNYANKLTEQQLKMFFGWTGDSKMVSTYVHLSGRDIDNAVLKAYGRESHVETAKPTLDIKVCPRCRLDNAMTAIYCTRCGSALDIATVVRSEEIETKTRELAKKVIEEKAAREKVTGDIKKRTTKRKTE